MILYNSNQSGIQWVTIFHSSYATWPPMSFGGNNAQLLANRQNVEIAIYFVDLPMTRGGFSQQLVCLPEGAHSGCTARWRWSFLQVQQATRDGDTRGGPKEHGNGWFIHYVRWFYGSKMDVWWSLFVLYNILRGPTISCWTIGYQGSLIFKWLTWYASWVQVLPHSADSLAEKQSQNTVGFPSNPTFLPNCIHINSSEIRGSNSPKKNAGVDS